MSCNEEMILCRLCGRSVPITGTKLCDRCYDLETGFASLAHRGAPKALKWLGEKLAAIRGDSDNQEDQEVRK